MTFFLLHFLQIAYQTASSRFPGKLSELFLVLSDDYRLPAAKAAEGEGYQSRGDRGQKHRLDDDQMSVKSVGSKRMDLSSSADKSKSKPKPGHGAKNKAKAK